MIDKINISKFGLFNDYQWDNTIGKGKTFRKVNIIYGRNYSGKTTLARIFKCLEDDCLHKDYSDADFAVTLDDKTIVHHDTLDTFKDKVRVYNTDFVRQNLSWLHNEDGSIEPFTILGAENVELEGKISKINEDLGSIEEEKGLIHELAEEKKKIEVAIRDLDAKKLELDNKLRARANDKIKLDNSLFVVTSAKKSYSISDITSEIGQIKDNPDEHLLSSEKAIELAKSLKETSLADVDPLKEVKPNFAEFLAETKQLLDKKITPTKTITELINDSILQEWVRQGINQHKGIRNTCGFCGNPLSDDLWVKLDAHFNKESEELRSLIKTKIDRLNIVKENLATFLTLNRDSLYLSLHASFAELVKGWDITIASYQAGLDELIRGLEMRMTNIFGEVTLPELKDVSENIIETIKSFNALVTQHNLKSGTLAKDQEKNRRFLRFSHIAQFVKDIGYVETTRSLEKMANDLETMKTNIVPKESTIETLHEEKRKLLAEADDESRGAELVNKHLSHFFGHDELKLVPEGSKPQIKFTIQREDVLANNLSEGECSLISFCYFIAKMEDELKDEVNSNKLIIYIDDPISSLDCNHIFFMFSLIENIIAKPKKYGQLFISTHNLDFLKYLKHLTFPKYKPLEGSKDKKPDVGHFMIERKGPGLSILKNSPSYLKDYVTEFNYLFHQLYSCSVADEETITTDYQYSFGNNLRKFLEAYTFYKYPSHKLSFTQRLEKLFADDRVSMILIFRMINEYSHLEDQFDRAVVPMEISEISKKIGRAHV